ncbi:hypothetical protein CKM354_000677500 [Cercospora kikuchii]|uniref:Uncharacterized protein n=1 Tax=Cercospora kikuchii TaxID=84275 RepID=A0A9P3CIV5_9PEZI|nr:uncharacterized protein CKM354_000677500 [Cercospora kikuchii]GIZ43553.1 hypothetical protein CKM354_000677500 [Cercospora kikuchii]
MPSLSSLFGLSAPAQPPCLIFQGPDSQGSGRVVDLAQRELAQFTKTKNAIYRSGKQVCTFKHSSMSGTTTLQFEKLEIKMKQTWESLQYGKDIKTPTGTLQWRAGSGGYEELRNEQKVLLARGKLPGTLWSKHSDLEIYVPGDELLLDLIISLWVSMLKIKAGDDVTEKVADGVVEALVGG